VPDKRALNRWSPTDPYGAAKAADGMGTIAAPLLAAASLGLIGLVLQVETSLKWASLALLLLIVASASLITSVQATFWMRQYDVTPAELVMWHDDANDRMDVLRTTHWTYQVELRVWQRRAARTYQFGIVALYAAIAVVLIPAHHVTAARVLAVVAAALATLGELLWILTTSVVSSRRPFAEKVRTRAPLRWLGAFLRVKPTWVQPPDEYYVPSDDRTTHQANGPGAAAPLQQAIGSEQQPEVASELER